MPQDILPGLLTALHFYFHHLSEHQKAKVFNHYSFAIKYDSGIKDVLSACHQCSSMRYLPREMFEQSSTPSSTAPGQQFASDVIRRNGQKLFAIWDVHSSFTSDMIILDEFAGSLRSTILLTTSMLRTPSSIVRVDNASGFQSLREDRSLASHGITLDFGRVKNVNKNPVPEKGNQELEIELLRQDPSGAPVSALQLDKAVCSLNSRIRKQGLSAKEILFCRDQLTCKQLDIDDKQLCALHESIHGQNHFSSAKSKAWGRSKAKSANISLGYLVHIKSEGSKFRARDQYIVTDISDRFAILQKLNGSSFISRQYQVPLSDIFPVMEIKPSNLLANDSHPDEPPDHSDSDDNYCQEEILQFLLIVIRIWRTLSLGPNQKLL